MVEVWKKAQKVLMRLRRYEKRACRRDEIVMDEVEDDLVMPDTVI
jgi:hypothetical protein